MIPDFDIQGSSLLYLLHNLSIFLIVLPRIESYVVSLKFMRLFSEKGKYFSIRIFWRMDFVFWSCLFPILLVSFSIICSSRIGIILLESIFEMERWTYASLYNFLWRRRFSISKSSFSYSDYDSDCYTLISFFSILTLFLLFLGDSTEFYSKDLLTLGCFYDIFLFWDRRIDCKEIYLPSSSTIIFFGRPLLRLWTIGRSIYLSWGIISGYYWMIYLFLGFLPLLLLLMCLK